MTGTYAPPLSRPKGFFASLSLALRIARGSARLLWRYPKLVLPLIPIFLLVLMAVFALFFVQNVVVALLVVFAVAYALMFSFAITAQMLRQIDEDGAPSLLQALTSSSLVRMIPRVLALSFVWYVLVALLVAIEGALRLVLDRISDDLADAVVNLIFGTLADALRMAGFMLVAIMTFEDSGMREALTLLRAVTRDNPITILGGLVLTKFMGLLSLLIVMFSPGILGILVFFPLGILWILSMYLEQLFVTGLYLYSTRPTSRLVSILLQDFVGRELPDLRPGLSQLQQS